MEREKPRVVAVVVTYESAQSLAACIEALARQEVPVIVVDNASRDESAAVARAAGARVIASGDCMLVRRSTFLDVGGFDENIFLFYEDDDLCLRARQAGFTIVRIDTAVGRHVRGGSSAPSPGRIFRSRRHQAWSRSYVSRKHGVADDRFWVLIRNGLKLLVVLPTFNRRRIERYAGSGGSAWLRACIKDAGWNCAPVRENGAAPLRQNGSPPLIGRTTEVRIQLHPAGGFAISLRALTFASSVPAVGRTGPKDSP